MTPEQRSLKARMAANTRWGKETDRIKATEPGRKAAKDRFYNQTDPSKSHEDRLVDAQSLELAPMQRMWFKRSMAASRRKSASTAGRPHRTASTEN